MATAGTAGTVEADEVRSANMAAKKVLRSQISSTLRALEAEFIGSQSRMIAERVATLPQVQAAERVSIYLSMPSGEVQTAPLLEWLFAQKKRVFVPKVVGKTSGDMRMPELASLEELAGMSNTAWGIPEFSAAQLATRRDALQDGCDLCDVVLAPGVAFTSGGGRLGHGKGHYDCFLSKLQAARSAHGLAPAAVIGLAFDEQMVKEVPLEAHDVPLDAVVTPAALHLRTPTPAPAGAGAGAGAGVQP